MPSGFPSYPIQSTVVTTSSQDGALSVANQTAARLSSPSASSTRRATFSSPSHQPIDIEGTDMPAYPQRPLFRPIQVGPSPPQISSHSSDNTPSPTSTTPKLGSKRGRITAIACVPCKKRKSKCNGLQPVCNTCAIKGSTCSYDMRQEHRWQGTLRVNVKKLEQELDEVKSVLPLLATTSQRDAATRLALEIQNNGFSEHSAEEIKSILQGPRISKPSEGSAPAVEPLGEGSARSDATPDSVPAYFMGYDNGISSAMPQTLPQATEAQQWPSHALLTSSDSGVWMTENSFSPPQHGSVAPYREDSVTSTGMGESKQNRILTSNAPNLCVPSHILNHPSMNFNHTISQTSAVSPITYVFTTYREGKRQLRADGCPSARVFGNPDNDYNAILGGETDFSMDQPLSTWVARVANVFFANAGLPEKLAAAELLRDVMQWQICPSRQNFERLPEWVRPTQNQTVIPHDPTIDFLPWPSVRDFYLHNPEHYVAGALVNAISVNWNYEESRIFFCDPNSGNILLSSMFKAHIRNIHNWSLSPEVFEQMPFLMGKARMTGIH